MIYAWFKLGSSREHGDGSTGSIDRPHLRRTPRPREPRGQGHIGATIELFWAVFDLFCLIFISRFSSPFPIISFHASGRRYTRLEPPSPTNFQDCSRILESFSIFLNHFRASPLKGNCPLVLSHIIKMLNVFVSLDWDLAWNRDWKRTITCKDDCPEMFVGFGFSSVYIPAQGNAMTRVPHTSIIIHPFKSIQVWILNARSRCLWLLHEV